MSAARLASGRVYLLYIDDSGSHGAIQGNHAYVLAGLAIHEDDAARLQHALAER